MPIEPPEIPPATPGQPTEPPQEDPPGNPQPEAPPPMREPGEPPRPDELPGQTPSEFPARGPSGPSTPNPATALTAMQFASSVSHAQSAPIVVTQAKEELGPDGKPKQPPKGAQPPAKP